MAAEIERVALVCGAARGLGLATARALAAEGWRAHVTWRSSRDAARALEPEFPGRVHQADFSRVGAAEEVVARVLARDARLDALVHAVGDWDAAPLAEVGVEGVERLFASNVATAVRAFDAARAALRGSRGSALFFGVAGLEGLRGRRSGAAYAAAKSALLVLVRSWALEEGPHGVRVNLLSPGLVPHAHAAPQTRDPALVARVPLGRAGTPEEVAAAAAFLVSGRAGYVTGADLPVAGGWLS